MRILKIEPGKQPEIIEIEKSLKALQEQVGGYIETLTFAEDAALIVDEEGKLKGKPYNFTFCGEVLVGTVLFVGVDGEEFCDIPAMATDFITKIFGRRERDDTSES